MSLTYTGGEYSVQDLFNELKELVKQEGILTFEGYAEAVDEIVEEKSKYGFFSENEDLMQIKSALEKRWSEIGQGRSE